MTVWLLLAWLQGCAFQERASCVPPGVHDVVALPASFNLELVGVGFDRKMKPNVVIRRGTNKAAMSAVYRTGDRVMGRLRVVSIGAHSVLLRMDGRLYVLKLRGRSTRDWSRALGAMPQCSASAKGS